MNVPSHDIGQESDSLKLPLLGITASPTMENPSGGLTFLGQKFYNDTAQETEQWGTPNHTEPQPHPLANFSNLKTA
jgi:hypothetical protein